MKNIVILGSTGSIGVSALEVVSAFPDRFRVVGLTAGRNAELLAEQIERYRPEAVAVPDESAYARLKVMVSSGVAKPEILCGVDGISSIAALPHADIVISAIVGAAGLMPTLTAVRAGKVIGLANKETLVVAGEIVMSEAERHGSVILPVDSEHSAVFQCLKGHDREGLRKIILTASGGPFVGRTKEELDTVSAAEALKHPNWSMGRKISIDSATLMNKGLEVIEACHLFGLGPDSVDVLIHPQSIIHSMAEFLDGSYLAQLSRPDMKGPIAYALSYPERLDGALEKLNWEALSGLTFRQPDLATFPSLSLAYDAIRTGGTMPSVLNASNEVAVSAFLDGNIGFNEIPVIISKVMGSHTVGDSRCLEAVLEADIWARGAATNILTAGR